MSRYKRIYGNPNDIDVRDGISKIIYGVDGEAPRGKIVIFRKMKRDSNGNLIYCPKCTDLGTKGNSRYYPCDVCFGSGKIWKESYIKAYEWSGNSPPRSETMNNMIVSWGKIEKDVRLIYVTPEIRPTNDDEIILIDLDEKGNVVIPVQRYKKYEIKDVNEYRLDFGKLEFYGLVCVPVSGYIGQPINQLYRPTGV